MRAPRIARDIIKWKRKERDGMSRAHLDNMAGLPCLGCGQRKATVVGHHLCAGLMAAGVRGMGMKAPDRFAVPLCFECHDAVHHYKGGEEAWLMERAVDGRAASDALWAARGDVEAMARVVFRFRQMADLALRERAAGEVA